MFSVQTAASLDNTLRTSHYLAAPALSYKIWRRECSDLCGGFMFDSMCFYVLILNECILEHLKVTRLCVNMCDCVPLQVGFMSKTFTTSFTDKHLLSAVNLCMDIQVPFLHEALPTYLTLMQPLSQVTPHVRQQVVAGVEASAADVAGVGFDARVRHHVPVQAALHVKLCCADAAVHHVLPRVEPRVDVERVLPREELVAD